MREVVKADTFQAPRKIATICVKHWVHPGNPGCWARARERSVRTVIAWLLLCGPLLAAPVSEDYPCVQGHEQAATTKLQAFVKEAITNFFRNRNIPINPSTLQISFNARTQGGTDSPAYFSFTGNAGTSGLAASSLAGTVAAQDGTKFNILLSSGSNDQDAAEYRIIRTESGFNREGNAIAPHCRLRLFNSGDIESTKTLLVVNAASGHALGLIRLPAVISLY
jgi:hypothetical protein